MEEHMRQRWYKLLALTLLVVLCAATAVYAGPGKVTGVVKDTEGQAAAGANVVLEGTTLGAAADADGLYFILNVPPGTYRVRASAVGYVPKVVTNIRVSEDQIVTVNFDLQSEAVGIAEVVVQAERPPVDISQTNARTRLSGEDFQSLPIRDVSDLVATSASSYKGFIRGGRQFETKTIVDGIDMTDQYAGWYSQVAGPGGVFMTYNGVVRFDEGQNSALTSLNQSSVEDASVSTGGVGADYNSSTAGVVSYSLREGRGAWTGRVYARMSQTGGLTHLGANLYNDDAQYFATKANLAASPDAGNQAKAQRFTYYQNKYPYGTRPDMQVEGAIGGSVTPDFGLYFTGGYNQSSYRLPNQSTKRLNGTLKLNYNLSPDLKLNFTGLLEDRGEIFGWKNTNYSEDFRFFLEGVPQWSGYNMVGSLKLTHILSKETFYEVQLSSFTDKQLRGYSDDNGDGILTAEEALTTDGDYMEFADTAQVNANMGASGTSFEKFFTTSPRNEVGSETGTAISGASNWKIARPGIYYENFTNTNYTLKADITSQVTDNHQLRGGVQVRLHDLNMTRRAGYIGGVYSNYQAYVDEEWHVRPAEYSAYVQDRMEYAGLIINVGLRLDGLNNNVSPIANYFAPFEVNGSDGVGPYRYLLRSDEKAGVNWFLSPRIGVSHPISDRASMYFSFSRQQQSVPYSQLFLSYNDFGNPSLPQIVRADQDPIRSTNYDLGLQWSFAEDWGVDVSAYYKDILNYGVTSMNVGPAAPWRNYVFFTNFGYADSRGVELTLKRNVVPVTKWLSIGGRVSYAYSYIKAAVPAGANVNSWSTAAGDSAKYAGQLPLEDLKTWNTIEQNVRGGASTLTGGYDRSHRIQYNIFLRFPVDFTLSALGTHTSGFFYPLTLADPRSRELGEGPWNHRVDFRLEKGFALQGIGRLAIFVDLVNAFNAVNVIAYNQTTVGQLAWEQDGDPTGGPTVNRAVGKSSTNASDGSLIYDVPREVYFGVNFTF
jgi:hypothetical protein